MPPRFPARFTDHIVAPVRPERYSLNGLIMLRRLIEKVRGRQATADDISIVINVVSNRFGAANVDMIHTTRLKISEFDFFRAALIEPEIPFSTTLQAGLSEAPVLTPMHNTALLSRAPPALKQALSSAWIAISEKVRANL